MLQAATEVDRQQQARVAKPVRNRTQQTGTACLRLAFENEKAVSVRDHESSPWYQSLNGKWKFHWTKNPDNRPKDFYKPSFYTGGWADINVPGNWERQGIRYRHLRKRNV